MRTQFLMHGVKLLQRDGYATLSSRLRGLQLDYGRGFETRLERGEAAAALTISSCFYHRLFAGEGWVGGRGNVGGGRWGEAWRWGARGWVEGHAARRAEGGRAAPPPALTHAPPRGCPPRSAAEGVPQLATCTCCSQDKVWLEGARYSGVQSAGRVAAISEGDAACCFRVTRDALPPPPPPPAG